MKNGFTPFQLLYGIEAVLPIECEIPSVKLAIELLPNTLELEKRLIYLEKLDKNVETQPHPMMSTNGASKHNMINRLNLGYSPKKT